MNGFLEPTGGDPKGQWFMSGPGILTAVGLDVGAMMHRASVNPKGKHFSRTAQHLVPGSGTRALTDVEMERVKLRAATAWVATSPRPVGGGPGMPAKGMIPPSEAAVERSRRAARWRGVFEDRRATERVLRGQGTTRGTATVGAAQRYMRAGRFMRGMGILFLMEAAFEVSMTLSTPGITSTAAKNDAMLFADERVLDSSAAWTQRQRAVRAISDSQLTVRGIIGNEATYLHR